jgi:UDP-N-acetylmuramoyl-tripeptide--D-alanyl-D-alanine ligase
MIKNKAEFRYNDLAVLFGEHAVSKINEMDTFTGVSIDSRTTEKGNIFVAIVGENIDGHTKIDHAFENGASVAISVMDKYNNESGKPVIFVKDTTAALGKLANHHRRRFNYPVIAIAGSNGKTTTKELSAHLLSRDYNVLKTHKNFNNQFGTPLMLLQMTNEYDMAVLELGTNQPGEVFILSEMVEPTHGLITNIGKEHLEFLENIDGVEMEETALFSYLIKNNGLTFLNMDDPRLIKYTKVLNSYFTYGSGDELNMKARIEIDDYLLPEITLYYNGRQIKAKMQVPGYIMGLNAVAASALALHFGIEDDDLIEGLASFENSKFGSYGRLLVEKIAGITIINDTYNANPESMQRAVESLVSMPVSGKRYAVLADMLELGSQSEKEHFELLSSLAGTAINVLLFGEEMKKQFLRLENKNNIRYFNTKQNMSVEINAILEDGDIILIKGSRGMKMEEVVDSIKESFLEK